MSDPIYTVDFFHDRPIEGFANFEGDPHHFKCEFDHDADEYSDVYCLTPISAATLRLVLERWQIWLRWNAAFWAGETLIGYTPSIAQGAYTVQSVGRSRWPESQGSFADYGFSGVRRIPS